MISKFYLRSSIVFFVSKLNITLIRYKFFTRNQEEGESIQQYVTALRLLSKNCNFKELEDELIKDRIVCGIRSLRVRDRLLRCEDLNLDKAVKLCQAEEISRESEQQMDAVGTSSGVAQVDVVGAQRRRGRGSAGGGRRGARRGAAPSPHLCARCGGLSPRCQAGNCPANQCTCFVCGNRGHFAKVCKANAFYKGGGTARVCDIKHRSESESDDGDSFFISMIEGNKRLGEWFEVLSCGSGTEKFKLDTGADINVMSFERFLELGLDVSILKCNKVIKLQSYSGDVIPVKGTCYIACVYKGKQYELKFAIADMKCQSVLGRISCIQLNLIKRIHSLNLSQYDDLFDGIGCLPGKYHIVIDKSVRPVISAARKIPLSLRDQLAEELKRMERYGVIKKVTHPTDWVHPLVIVAKKNNTIRVCLDPRELNRAVRRAHFQLPTVTELAARLHGATHFSVLDANSGFWAVQLDQESADLCTFISPFGRYQFLRLPFGINCASEVFHGKIRQLLEDLEGVDSFIDDIIVWGKDKEEHDRRLDALLNRAREINLKFNKAKCKIGVREVTYLGHIFDRNGMRPDSNKVKAITEMPEPTDRKSLERFLGAVNYLSKFIPKYSELALPLTNLLRKDTEWLWECAERSAFQSLCRAVSSAPVLALYDVSAPVLVSVDASAHALGAVLMQAGRPVEFASRTLTDTQRRYAQVEKELLAIVFACSDDC
nr:uncharacterized protein K02A2.6-like [Helicoverpa armigera]